MIFVIGEESKSISLLSWSYPLPVPKREIVLGFKKLVTHIYNNSSKYSYNVN